MSTVWEPIIKFYNTHHYDINAAAVLLFSFAALRFIFFSAFVFYLLNKFKSHLIKICPKPWPKWSLFRDFTLSCSSILIFKLANITVFITSGMNIFNIYFEISEHSISYFIFTIIISIIVFDAYFYWSHRFLHLKKMMKHVHIVHHECQNLSVLSAYAFHPVEAFIYPWGIVILSVFIPVHVTVFAIMQLLILIQNMTIHCGYTLYPEKFSTLPLLKYLNRPIHHDDHHNQHQFYNFGFFFNYWDRMMRTFYPSKVLP